MHFSKFQIDDEIEIYIDICNIKIAGQFICRINELQCHLFIFLCFAILYIYIFFSEIIINY